MRMPIKSHSLCLSFFLAISHNAFADSITINNNSSPPQPQQAPQPAQQQCGGNQNNVYDPRVLPEGSYVIKNSDGSSNQVYTTGEKKPYYVDNSGCNASNVAPVQPYVFMGGGGRRGR